MRNDSSSDKCNTTELINHFRRIRTSNRYEFKFSLCLICLPFLIQKYLPVIQNKHVHAPSYKLTHTLVNPHVELMQLHSCSHYVSLRCAELQWSDRCRAADSPARQDHHLCQSPQEQHHRPGVPGNDALIQLYCAVIAPLFGHLNGALHSLLSLNYDPEDCKVKSYLLYMIFHASYIYTERTHTLFIEDKLSWCNRNFLTMFFLHN